MPEQPLRYYWTLVSCLYEDRGYSGSHLRRHGFQSLLADIKRVLIDVVVVHRFDRLTRNLSDFQRIIAEFNAHSVALASVTQQLDMSHHVGRLATNILTSFADFDASLVVGRLMKLEGVTDLLFPVNQKALVLRLIDKVTVHPDRQLYTSARSRGR